MRSDRLLTGPTSLIGWRFVLSALTCSSAAPSRGVGRANATTRQQRPAANSTPEISTRLMITGALRGGCAVDLADALCAASVAERQRT